MPEPSEYGVEMQVDRRPQQRTGATSGLDSLELIAADRRFLGAALLFLATLKLAGLWAFGPLVQPDTPSYLETAAMMRESAAWLHTTQIDSVASPPTVFRIFGYPLLIAGAQALLGPGKQALHLVVVMQGVVSLLATVAVFRLGRTLLRSAALAFLAAMTHALGVAFTYDQHILSDSLFNSLYVLAFALPLAAYLERAPLALRTLAGAGVALGAACLFRGIGLYLSVLVVPAALLWVLGASDRHWLRKAALALAFLAPPIAVLAGVHAWNHYRTGQAFYTTGAQTVLLQSLTTLAGRGTNLFDTDAPIDRLAREHLERYEYAEIGRVVEGLFNEYGMDAVASARAHRDKFLSSFLRRPDAFLLHGLRKYDKGSVIRQFFDLPDTIHVYYEFATGKRLWPGTRELKRRAREADVAAIALLTLLMALRAVALLSLLALVVGVPVLAARELHQTRRLGRRTLAVLYLFALYVTYSFGLHMVHFEPRFLPAVLPAGLLGSLFVFQTVARARARG